MGVRGVLGLGVLRQDNLSHDFQCDQQNQVPTWLTVWLN